MIAGLVSKIVVWRLDRLGRTAAGLTALFEDLQRQNIGFEGALRDKVDLSTAAGRLGLANVLASVAAYKTKSAPNVSVPAMPSRWQMANAGAAVPRAGVSRSPPSRSKPSTA